MYLRFLLKFMQMCRVLIRGVTDVERDRVGKLIALLCMHSELKILCCTVVHNIVCVILVEKGLEVA